MSDWCVYVCDNFIILLLCSPCSSGLSQWATWNSKYSQDYLYIGSDGPHLTPVQRRPEGIKRRTDIWVLVEVEVRPGRSNYFLFVLTLETSGWGQFSLLSLFWVIVIIIIISEVRTFPPPPHKFNIESQESSPRLLITFSPRLAALRPNNQPIKCRNGPH